MTIHILQHVHFETPGYILDWARDNSFQVTYTRFFEDETLPEIDDIDGLVVMGGPMGVYDEGHIGWLAREKVFLKSCIDREISVLGICLGAQLIAEVLGSKVYKHTQREIGWFPIDLMLDPSQTLRLKVFHWHGDTYDLPEGAVQIALSDGCDQQGFLYKNHVLALQFHFEAGIDEVSEMLEHDAGDIGTGPFVQSKEEMVQVDEATLEQNRVVLSEFLRKLFIDVSL